MSNQYILVHGKPTPVHDVIEWARWFEKADRHVAQDMIGDVRVSTVFLGLDHRHLGEGPPILWETMVFGGKLDGEMNRYCSEEDARRGHAEMVHKVRSAGEPVVSRGGDPSAPTSGRKS